jgi:hypothetical protein
MVTDVQVKEVCRLIRLARSYWDAHNNLSCRTTREQALQIYQSLTLEQKSAIPQSLKVWLRYRSEKYFGQGNGQGAHGNAKKRVSPKPPNGKIAQALCTDQVEPESKLSRRAERWLQTHQDRIKK